MNFHLSRGTNGKKPLKVTWKIDFNENLRNCERETT